MRTFVSLPAGFTRMPLAPFLFYSALGTVLWTTALAYAGVVLQSNVGLVGDYINIATNVVLGVIGVMICGDTCDAGRTLRIGRAAAAVGSQR